MLRARPPASGGAAARDRHVRGRRVRPFARLERARDGRCEDLYENLWDDVLCTDQEEHAARGTRYTLETLCDALELTGGERAHFVRTVRALFPGTYSGIWESLCAGY